ncbi:hypothetical protein [Haladaptatus sp. YSMS36]|uniref:hypothetical protein n=1 Tax=Haladaptatus sp. YSMS36 TaxID=3033384 RepID=UPI0023E868AD|nr:hypothetical protein [Haladaptatus sp. YSMS36]
MAQPKHSRTNTKTLRWALLATAIFTAVGGLAAAALTRTLIFLVFYGGFGLPTREFPLLAGLAAGLVGGTSWWLLVERPGHLTRERGGLVGLITGVLVHPIAWVFILGLYTIRTGVWDAEGNFLVFLLFLYWGLGLVGGFTVIMGVFASLLVIVARERLSKDVVTGRSLLVVGLGAVVGGWIAVTVIVILGVFALVVVGGGLLAAGVTVVALRRLPVVRTFLGWCYRVDPEESAQVRAAFRRRHAAVLSVGVIGFLLGALGYASLVVTFCSEVLVVITQQPMGALYVCQWESRFTFYPVFFVVASTPVLLVVNRVATGFAPRRSIRRAVVEWLVFFALVSASYTVAFVVLWPL